MDLTFIQPSSTIRPMEEQEPSKGFPRKWFFIIGIAVLVVLGISGAAFWYGKNTATPTPTPTPVSQTLSLGATAALDGWRASNGGSNWDYPYIQAGHNSTLTERGFVSFDISSIPSGAAIDQVTLRLYQTEVVGTPYTSSLIVDHVNYGTSQSATPYDGSPIASNIGTLTNNATIEWKDILVTGSVKDDITNARGRAQFAIRFATEATGADAWARFTSADGSGNTPQLVINYH